VKNSFDVVTCQNLFNLTWLTVTFNRGLMSWRKARQQEG